jgi:hypothetical protein
MPGNMIFPISVRRCRMILSNVSEDDLPDFYGKPQDDTLECLSESNA